MKKMVRCDTDEAGSITDFNDLHTALAGIGRGGGSFIH